MKGKEWGRARARREADKEEPTDSERGFSNIIRPQLPSMVSSLSLARSFVRSFLLDRATAHTHTHAPCSSASRIFKQVISPPYPLLSLPLLIRVSQDLNERRTAISGRCRSMPARHACVYLHLNKRRLLFVSNMSNNCAKMWKIKHLVNSRRRFAERGISNNAPHTGIWHSGGLHREWMALIYRASTTICYTFWRCPAYI